MRETTWDVIIAGGGPAGLAAALHAAALGWDTLVVTRGPAGGAVRRLALVASVPWMPVGLSGSEYVERLLTRAAAYGVTLRRHREVLALRPGPEGHRLACADGAEYRAHAVIIATGADFTVPAIPGAAELAGAGVFAAVPADASALTGRRVVVAGQAADVVPVADALRDRCREAIAVVLPDREVTTICGVGGPETVIVRDHRAGRTRALVADTVLLPCPAVPRDQWLGASLEALLAGGAIAAAGGVRHRAPIPVTRAIAEGIEAAERVHGHLTATRRAR